VSLEANISPSSLKSPPIVNLLVDALKLNAVAAVLILGV
jgi:hypothetical protein